MEGLGPLDHPKGFALHSRSEVSASNTVSGSNCVLGTMFHTCPAFPTMALAVRYHYPYFTTEQTKVQKEKGTFQGLYSY